MTQLAMHFPPASRRTDPPSSKAAEQRVTHSGQRRKQADIVLDAVKAHPGRTAWMLTQFCELDRYQIQRRLSDLERIGKVSKGRSRVCTVQGTQAVSWWPVGGEP